MERPAAGIVLGIDGGGTHTRVMAADLQGNVLAYKEQGSSSLQLLTAAFESSTVPVAFIGSVVNTAYVKRQLTDKLNTGNLKQYNVIEPFVPAVTGAVLLALKNLNVPVEDSLTVRLQSHPYAIR